MKATLRWLREFVDVEWEAGDLADRLTHLGLECTVEERGVLEGVVVGEVVEVKPHPGAERLKLCRVNLGSDVASVVCGAPNTRVGNKYPMALVGAHLPGDKLIAATEIRGARSEGMLCSEAELDVGEDASGLWDLPSELAPGTRLDQALDLVDWVFEFDLTPNRGDCLSILGLSYEIAALADGQVRLPELSLAESGLPIEDRFEIILRDPDLCPRYVARLVEGTRLGPAPLWMRRRLQLVGIRPINNLVDVTNYVMWELGQPLHAFDLDLLEEGRIVVQRAKVGETFVSLDGQERRLTDDMLMIWDGVKPVAVAGVMGGENSEVGPRTRNVLIESALFNPTNVRRTAKALGMATEASRRFERGIDPEGCPRAADRAARLMAELSGASIAPGRIDAYPWPVSPQRIRLRPAKVNGLLGMKLPEQEIRSSLERLGLEVKATETEAMEVIAPPRRGDLTREVDLIEEVARLQGFDQVPTTLPRTSAIARTQDRGLQIESLVREILVGYGFYEIITYAFMDVRAESRLGMRAGLVQHSTVTLLNPIRQDQSMMRTTLLPGLLETVLQNFNRKNPNLRLFEVGRVYLPSKGELLPREARRLALAVSGARYPEHWSTARENVDVFDLKGVLQGLTESLQVADIRFVPAAAGYLREGSSMRLEVGGAAVGFLGELSPAVMAAWDLPAPAFVAEVDFEALVESACLKRSFRPLPRFPEVARDLSVLVDEGVSAGDVLGEVRRAEPAWLQDVYLYDIFTGGEHIPFGKKSLTFRLRYRSLERNLTDEEVNEQQQKVIELLSKRFGARLRS
jgi:phenylalanyl-tRNA synthetase beta chain